jgi:endogenous inhibitor of DNA gyrase (YacG/DUF329 family)
MAPLHCPVCDRLIDTVKEGERSFVPFCSERCRLIDLGRWLGEGYSVAIEADPEAAEPDAGME